MQIDAVELFHVALPRVKPLRTAWGDLDTLHTVLVRMHSGDACGWGEASPGTAPLLGPEWAAGVFACLRDWLAPRVVGGWIETGDALQDRLSPCPGNSYAKAALDTAWWDLAARRQNKSLPELLGKARDAIEIGAGFDRMDTTDEFLRAISDALESGYSRIELKFRPGWDVQMVHGVRANFPLAKLHIDVEGQLRLEQMEMLCRLDDFQLALIEQPLPPDDLVGHAMVQETIRTPLCLDESIVGPRQADMALELHSSKFVNLKHGRVGGLTPAQTIHDRCHDECVPCYVGAMPQSAIGLRLGLALAAKPNCTYPADYLPPDGALAALAEDLAEAPQPVRDPADGVLRVPLWTEPGIGIEPAPAALAKFTVAQARLPQ